MEPNRPEQPPMEVLESEREPSRLERWAGALLRTRGRRVGVATVVLLAGGGLVASQADRDAGADAEPADAQAAVTATGLRPAPAIGRQGADTSSWRVGRDVSVRSGPRGHTVTFFAVNLGPQAQDPRAIQVDAEFVDRPRLTYEASCAGVERTPRGHQPLRGDVAAGDRVLVRCSDETKYPAAPARIDTASVTVRTTPCDGSGRSTRS